MAESWVRLWAGMTTDPKFRTVARKCGRPVIEVVGLFAHLLLIANESETRGDLDGLVVEDVASALDMDEECVLAILQAMEGRVIEDGRLTGWEKRQPQREDIGNPTTGAKTAAERKREQRAREAAERASMSRDVTHGHDLSRDVTHGHAPEADTEAEAEKGVNQASEYLNGGCAHEPHAALALSAAGNEGGPTEAGLIAKRMRTAGIQGVNTHDPRLHALLQAGITGEELCAIAEEPKSRGKAMAWVLAAAEGRRRDAAAVRPMPAGPPSGARASPRSMTREESRRIAASTRLSDFRAACAVEQQEQTDDDSRTIDAGAADTRLLG